MRGEITRVLERLDAVCGGLLFEPSMLRRHAVRAPTGQADDGDHHERDRQDGDECAQ
jgi:hypothetical protein